MSKVKIPEAFKPLWEPKRYKVYYGGRGAGKSWTFASVLLLLGVQKSTRILCAREVQHSMKESVHKLLADSAIRMGLNNFYQVKRDRIYGKNGTEFIFAGLKHDPMQIKSLEGIDICWVEEAQKVSETSWDVLIPTIRKEGSEIWVSFNPDLSTDPTYQKFVIHQREDCLLRKVNYYDNPFFTGELLTELEYLKEEDYDHYMHIWEGECAESSEAQVYKGKYVVEDFETPSDVLEFYYGLDWGFAQDPTAIIRCYIRDRDLYIDYEDGGTQIELDETYRIIDSIPESKRYTIRADCARPESISLVKRQGYKIEAAPKWAGSVQDGIEFIRSFRKIHIHTRCRETASEFAKYSYKVDRLTGDILPAVVDKWDHYLDALRYGLAPLIKNRNLKPALNQPKRWT